MQMAICTKNEQTNYRLDSILCIIIIYVSNYI